MRTLLLVGAVAIWAPSTTAGAAKPATPVSKPKKVTAEALMDWVESGCRFLGTGEIPVAVAARHFGRIVREIPRKALHTSTFDVQVSALPGWVVSVALGAVSASVPASTQIKVSELEQRWGIAEPGDSGHPPPLIESSAQTDDGLAHMNDPTNFSLRFTVHGCLVVIEVEGHDDHSARLTNLRFVN